MASSHAALPTGDPPAASPRRASRSPLKRDLLVRFVPVSLALHALTAAPWAKIFAALLHLLGIGSGPVHWKQDVDAPTIIPIDLESFGDDSVTAPPGSNGSDGPVIAVKSGGDGGADGDADGGDAGPSDAAGDAGDARAGGDADAAPTDAGPPRVRDPNALAGGLATMTKKGEVNVSVLVRTDHMRKHEIGVALGGKLAKIEQWRPFFEGSDLDPVRDIDAILAYGPRFYETSRLTAILVHSKPDDAMTIVLRSLAARTPGSEWIGDDQVPAFRGKIDGADRVFVQFPAGIIVTPLDGEKQALDIAHALVAKGKNGHDLLPKGDDDLLVSWYLRKPANVMTDIPEDLEDTHITIRSRPDEGIVLDADAKAKDAKHATEDAAAVRKLVEGHLTGIQGAIARKWITGYVVEANGDVVRVHHELTGEQVSDIWTMLTTFGPL